MIFPGKLSPFNGAKIFFTVSISILLLYSAEAQTSTAAKTSQGQSSTPAWSLLWGTDLGLYSRDNAGRVEILWQGGKVKKIIPWVQNPSGGGGQAPGWALLSDKGIWVSENLRNWEPRSQGLPEKVIKIYRDGKKSFISMAQELTDLEINPENPQIMVCAVKDSVFLSRTGGNDWENLGMPNFRSNGIKAVTSFTGADGVLTVLCSHSIYGIYSITPDKSGAKWIEMNKGLEKLETTDNPDEVSDLKTVKTSSQEVYASQTFRRRIYRLDIENKEWKLIWAEQSEFGSVDSLSPGKNSLRFVRDGSIVELQPVAGGADASFKATQRQDMVKLIGSIPENYKVNCAAFRENLLGPGSEITCFSELWLLDPNFPKREQAGKRGEANGKEGLYLPVNHAMDPSSLAPYLDIIEKRGLNMVVIDMKDDYGRLRFTPQNPAITAIGRVFRPVDLSVFLKTMRDRGIYTVARIVVFKDPEAARKDNFKYAVWDGPNNKPWEGYYDTRQKKLPPGDEPKTNTTHITAVLPSDDPDYEIVRTWYDEKWVDPYSEEIWDYNASIAEELVNRGFDEVQFDYIRFPTDGANLADARYRWQENGMDMDSAILSFLRHVRSKVDAPISVDIYGANGWYRTGARTGQEVELLAPWVDIICPMYYPSHFEQKFLAQSPPELRPYRIYSQGIHRTNIISRGQVIVRPWTQAFYLNVSYDKKYYNTDYVRLETEGSRAAGNGGFTYWNNGGRYDDIPVPDKTASP